MSPEAAPRARHEKMSGISLLRVATLIYAAILVAALAIALIVIAVNLWRIAATLGRVRRALTEVRERSTPLKQNLDGLSSLTEQKVEEFEEATMAIERAAGVPNEADVLESEAAKL